MKLLALSLALCGFCFGQNNPRGAAAHQVSEGACSINASDVRGNVSVSINGPACNNLSKANVALIKQLVELLRDNIDALRSQQSAQTDYGTYRIASSFNPSSETAPVCSNVPTLVGSPGSTTLESLNRNLGIDPVVSNSILTGADQTFAFKNISALAADNYTIGQRQPTDLLLTGSSAVGATLALASFSNAPLGTSAIGTGADQPFLSKSLSDLTADDHLIGRQQPTGLLLTGDSAVGATLASASFSNTPLGASAVLTGTDQPSVFKNISALTAGNYIIAQQQAAGLLPTSDSVVGLTLDSVSLTFTNAATRSTSIITGTDYPSLSKSISDLTSSGHIITGWTITYLDENKPR